MPGDTEQVTMTFYGHADIWGQAKAICEVEGGPTYEILLKGEASLVEYKFDTKEIDYGMQVGEFIVDSFDCGRFMILCNMHCICSSSLRCMTMLPLLRLHWSIREKLDLSSQEWAWIQHRLRNLNLVFQ